MPDLKDLTLHSFGDSFTYGDGIFTTPHDANDHTVALFDKKREAKSYTGVLAKEFKNAINYGLPANNNEYMFTQMLAVANEPDFDPKKNFFLINLTDPARMGMSMSGRGNNIVYSLVNAHSITHFSSQRITNKVANELVYSLFDDVANIHRYYNTLSSILYFLERTGVPYYMFPGINSIDDTSTEIDRMSVLTDRIKGKWYQPPDRVLSEERRMKKDILDLYNELHPKFKHYDLFKNTLTPWVPLDWDDDVSFFLNEIAVSYSLTKLMDVYSSKKYNNERYYKSQLVLECGHWNPLGHKVAANIILSRIKVQNYDYLLKENTNE